MFRIGKSAGWLQLPPDDLRAWAALNDVSFLHSKPGTIANKGGALLSTEDIDAVGGSDGEMKTLLKVPHSLILSMERVHEQAKADRDLRELLESLGDFALTPRGAILVFLLEQASLSFPNASCSVGLHGPFDSYVKSLPLEDLPTFWPSSETQLLVGTTLAPAVSSKLRSLRREYDYFCSHASATRWFATFGGMIDFDDWRHVDAMYRSRALDFPEIGHCMVPCIDLANHAAGEATVAIYEKNLDGDAVLLLRPGKHLHPEDEITITYGDEKGACEMLFSYGFLDSDIESAETLFLSLAIPDTDPYQSAKTLTADCAPGFKILDLGDRGIDWAGDFIWLLCVTADDGLRFEVARTVGGSEELQIFFGDHELVAGASSLRAALEMSTLWDVFKLRAVVVLQQRLFDQLQVLSSTQSGVEAASESIGTSIRESTFDAIIRLRRLEFNLMEKAYEFFEREGLMALIEDQQKISLARSPVVKRYLAEMDEGNNQGVEEEDGGDDADDDTEDFS